MNFILRTKVEDTLDPRVKPEDDDFNCLFLFVIPEVVIGNPFSLKNKEKVDSKHQDFRTFASASLAISIFAPNGVFNP